MTTGRINQVTTLKSRGAKGGGGESRPPHTPFFREHSRRQTAMRPPRRVFFFSSFRSVSRPSPLPETQQPTIVRRRPSDRRWPSPFLTLHPDLTGSRPDLPVPKDKDHRLRWRLPLEDRSSLSGDQPFTKACPPSG